MMQNKKIIAIVLLGVGILLYIGISVALLSVGVSLYVPPGTKVVTSNADSGEGTLRDAIQSGATKIFFKSPMTIALASSIEIKSDVAIYGTTLSGKALDITIEGSNSRDHQFSMLIISAENINLTVKNMSFTKGNAEKGGVINFRSNNGNLIMIDCTFFSNSAKNKGGAVYVESGNLVMADSTFFQNTVNDEGGAVFVDSGNDVSITNSSFEQNTANSIGGAVFVRTKDVSITKSTFTLNFSNAERKGAYGGAVYAYTENLAITDCTFTENSIGSSGGAVFVRTKDVSITNSVFTSNEARSGGAVCVNSGNNVSITGSTFMSNANGAVKVEKKVDNVSVTDSTFMSNGGAISVDKADNVSVTSSIFISNEVYGGGAVRVGSGNNLSIISSTFILNSANARIMNHGSGAIYVGKNIDAINPPSTLNIINSTFYQNTTTVSSGRTIYMVNGTINLLNSIIFGDIFIEADKFDDNVFNSAFNILVGGVDGRFTQNIDIENNITATSKEVFVTGELENNVLKINPSGPASGTGVWVGYQDDFKVINYSVPGSNIWTPFVGDNPNEPANVIKNSFRGATESR